MAGRGASLAITAGSNEELTVCALVRDNGRSTKESVMVTYLGSED